MTSVLQRAFAAMLAREDGQALVEYALILALVATASVTILIPLGGHVSSIFSSVNADF
jgi:Flp pilus assembly pilin Flp